MNNEINASSITPTRSSLGGVGVEQKRRQADVYSNLNRVVHYLGRGSRVWSWSAPLSTFDSLRAIMVRKLVETINQLPIDRLLNQYCDENSLQALERLAKSSNLDSVAVQRVDARQLQPWQLKSCLDLVELTSAEDYRNSEAGWSRTKKRKEMRLPDLRYLLLQEHKVGPSSPELAGFVSFMITYEDGHEVIYVYEIHLRPDCQGKGLGRTLMTVVATIGSNIGLTKAMLTVFKANKSASDWYAKLGYSIDEFSPPARRLRGGVMKEPTYLILSKALQYVGSP